MSPILFVLSNYYSFCFGFIYFRAILLSDY